MYLDLSIGLLPACNQGHKGGNISKLPFLQGDASPNCGNAVSPLSLSSKYRKNTRNRIAVSLLTAST